MIVMSNGTAIVNPNAICNHSVLNRTSADNRLCTDVDVISDGIR